MKIILAAFTIRCRKLESDDAHLVTQFLYFPCPMVCPTASLHTVHAGRQIHQRFHQFSPAHHFAKYGLTGRINAVKRKQILCQIDTKWF